MTANEIESLGHALSSRYPDCDNAFGYSYMGKISPLLDHSHLIYTCAVCQNQFYLEFVPRLYPVPER